MNKEFVDALIAVLNHLEGRITKNAGGRQPREIEEVNDLFAQLRATARTALED